MIKRDYEAEYWKLRDAKRKTAEKRKHKKKVRKKRKL